MLQTDKRQHSRYEEHMHGDNPINQALFRVDLYRKKILYQESYQIHD